MRTRAPLVALALGLAACGGIKQDSSRRHSDDDGGPAADAMTCPAPSLGCRNCSPGDNVWSHVLGGDREDFARSVSVGADGGVFVSGSFARTIDFCGSTFSSTGRRAGYVARYSPGGVLQWHREFDSEDGPIIVEDVVAMPDGSLYATGATPGAVRETPSSVVPRAVLVTKLDDSGEQVWVVRFSAPDSAVGTGIAASPDGTLVVSGSLTSTLQVGNVTVGGAGHNGAFVAALSPNGKPTWALALGSDGDVVGRDVVVDGRGHAFVLVDALEQVTLPAGGDASRPVEAFVAEVSPTGTPIRYVPLDFAPSLDCECRTQAFDLAIDEDGNVFVAGSYAEPSGTHAHTAFLQEAFVMRIAPGGPAATLATWLGSARAVAAGDGLIATGDFFGETRVGDRPLSAIGFSDALVVRLDRRGEVAWAHGFGTFALDSGSGVAFDAAGWAYVVGSTGDHHAPEGTIDFGAGEVPTYDQTDGYLAKYAW